MDELKETIKQSNDAWEQKRELRQEYNLKCLDLIRDIILRYPDWRFTQIIFNIGLAEDRFYEESIDTYKMLCNNITTQ